LYRLQHGDRMRGADLADLKICSSGDIDIPAAEAFCDYTNPLA
jgi:hypothetical protein